MNELQKVFNYNGGRKVRVIMKDGDPWWVLKDICEVLELSNSRIVSGRLEEDEVSQTYITDSLGRNQETTIINEPGLYNVILRSDKPEAKLFKRWITHDVIPSIRQTGSYTLQEPQKLIALALVEAQKIIEGQTKELQEMKPKAEFFDAVAESKDAIDIGSAAKVLNMGIGRNSLFEVLREKEILMSNNQPYQKYIDLGYFRTIEQKYSKFDGSTCINIKTLVYQKGLDFIRKIVSRKSA